MARKSKQGENEMAATDTTNSMFEPIEDEAQLNDILSGARGRGDYKTVLTAFIAAERRLAKVPLDKGLFEGKKAQTVKTGFENAKGAKEAPTGSDQVKVVKKGDDIFLVNQAVASA